MKQHKQEEPEVTAMRKKIIKGTSVKDLFTLDSMYSNGNLDVMGVNAPMPLRIHRTELLKLMKGHTFRAEPKRTYAYLKLIK